jgi:flagellar protein FliO/FliZ
LSKRTGALFAAFLAGLIFFTIPNFFTDAQESSGAAGEDQAIRSDAPDPLVEREQRLTLQEGSAEAPVAPSSAGSIFKVVLTLALSAAAIYGVVFFLKRVSRKGEVRDPFLKVLAAAPLTPGRNVHIVAAGSRAWLVGASEGGVNLISEIEDKDLLNAMFLEDSKRDAGAAPGGRPLDFKAMLKRLGMQVQGGAPGADNIRKRRERLKGL